MSEIKLNDRSFRLQKLDALTQLAIAVKLLPIIPSLKPVMSAAVDAANRFKDADAAVARGETPAEAPAEFEVSDDMIVNLGAALNKLGDDGRNYIIAACLRAVLMEVQNGGYLPAWSIRTEAPDPSIDLVTMLRLTYAVVMENIPSFSTAPASK